MMLILIAGPVANAFTSTDRSPQSATMLVVDKSMDKQSNSELPDSLCVDECLAHCSASASCALSCSSCSNNCSAVINDLENIHTSHLSPYLSYSDDYNYLIHTR